MIHLSMPAPLKGAGIDASCPAGKEKGKFMEGIVVCRSWLRNGLRSERGASMVEYGLLLALIAVIALVAVQAFGSGVSSQFSRISSSVAG